MTLKIYKDTTSGAFSVRDLQNNIIAFIEPTKPRYFNYGNKDYIALSTSLSLDTNWWIYEITPIIVAYGEGTAFLQ